jgi:DnaJ-class molecular chaperone
MDEDLYKILGVARSASQEEIQKAYRDMARRHHPDMNPDDSKAKEKFQRIQRAYDVLGNSEKREMYDRYGSSFETMGAGGPRGGAAGGAWRRGTGAGPGGGFEGVDMEELFGAGGPGGYEGGFADLLKQFAGGAAGGRRGGASPGPRVGRNLQHATTVPFRTAVLGGEMHVAVQRLDGKTETIAVKIPAGIEDGKKVRVRGKGESAGPNGKPGDLLITVHIAAHPHFDRRGHNLLVRVPVTLAEAAMGAKIDVPAPRGTLTLTVPPGTSSGKRLRAKGQGVHATDAPPGDLIAEIQIVLPETLDEEDLEMIRRIDSRHPSAPRADLRW